MQAVRAERRRVGLRGLCVSPAASMAGAGRRSSEHEHRQSLQEEPLLPANQSLLANFHSRAKAARAAK